MIEILPKDLVDKIAAGEVIERPSSVVKELVENSIDASADNIKVKIINGGLTSIIVEDDGNGISKSDIPKLILNHATSKIHNISDLYNIRSFGFRGEALASVASVSKLSVTSKTKDDETASTLSVIDSKIEIKTSAYVDGTKVIVEDLFYSIPARRKFLKSDRTERAYTIKLLQEIAVAHPDISFSLTTEKGSIFSYKQESLDQRIKNISPVALLDCSVIYDSNGLKISASLIPPGTITKQSLQLIYVNGRPINSPIVQKALKDSYVSYLRSDVKLSYIVFIDIDPANIDVNVHPRKLEVRFLYPSEIYSRITHAVENYFNRIAAKDIRRIQPDMEGELSSRISDVDTENRLPLKKENGYIKNRAGSVGNSSFISDSIDFTKELLTAYIPDINTTYDNTFSKNVLQVQNKFIVYEGDEGIVIVDQHAAAERVNYEKFQNMFRGKNIVFRMLLFPVALETTHSQYEILIENIKTFEEFGIKLIDLGNGIVGVEQIAEGIADSKVQDICLEIINDIENISKIGRDKMQDKIIASLACRSSIMFGDKLEEIEMKTLLNDLYACDTPFTCAHGRPVQYILPYAKLLHDLARC